MIRAGRQPDLHSLLRVLKDQRTFIGLFGSSSQRGGTDFYRTSFGISAKPNW